VINDDELSNRGRGPALVAELAEAEPEDWSDTIESLRFIVVVGDVSSEVSVAGEDISAESFLG